jgi:DNA-binding MarR family transcriptional regulator
MKRSQNGPVKKVSAEWKPHASWGGLMLSAAAEMSKRSKAAFNRHRLAHVSPARIGILSILLQGPSTQAEMSRALRVAPPSMMEMMERLEADGLVKRSRDESDKRKINWQISDKGKRDTLQARALMRTQGKMLDRFFSEKGVTPQEIERFKEVLRLLLDEYL